MCYAPVAFKQFPKVLQLHIAGEDRPALVRVPCVQISSTVRLDLDAIKGGLESGDSSFFADIQGCTLVQ